jgi:MFS family permease
VLAAGSYQGMLQLKSLVAQVPSGLGLGYGLGDGHAVGALFAAPAFGIMIGGTLAGWLAARVDPARTLLGGITIGAVATFAMLVGVSVLPLAVVCGVLLGMAAGAIVTSGFNLATSIAPPERHGVVSGLVSVGLGVGSVVVNVGGAAVLKATHTVVDGAPTTSATGVYLYVLAAGALCAAAAIVAIVLVRSRGAAPVAAPRCSPG